MTDPTLPPVPDFLGNAARVNTVSNLLQGAQDQLQLLRAQRIVITARDLAVGLPDGWELDEGGDQGARELTLRTVGYLAEYERGDRDEYALRTVLTSLVMIASMETGIVGSRMEIREFGAPVVSTQLASKSPARVSSSFK